MRSIKIGALAAVLSVCACGGGEDATKPAQAPAAPSSASVSSAQTPAPTDTVAQPEAPKASMADMQNAAIKAMFDGLNAHDADKATAFDTDDVVEVRAGSPSEQGKDGVKAHLNKVWSAFPDCKVAVGRTWQKNDVAVVEWGWTGTNMGEFMGMKATKKPAGVMALSIYWFTPEGKIKEGHHYMDGGSVAMQLGVPKAKGRAMVGLPTTTESHLAKGSADEDKNVEAAKALSMAMDKKDVKAFLDGMTDDETYDSNVMPQPMQGKKGAEAWFKMFTKAFPDLKNVSSHAWGVEDYVINEYVTTGTQKAPITGPQGTIPATGKTINLHGVEIMQLKDGKMAKGWSYENGVEFAMQLGLMKPPSEKSADAAKAGDKDKAEKAKGGEKSDKKPSEKAKP